MAESNSDNKKEPDIQPYDLTSQDRIIRKRMPVLEIIYERFINFFRVSLSRFLKKNATISLISTDFLKFGEFVNTLPIPSFVYLFKFANLKNGPALFVMEPKLSYSIVESSLGGGNRPYSKIEGKEFTPVELTILKDVMDLALGNLDSAWEVVYKIDARYVRTEVNPQFVGIVPPSNTIMATTFEIEFENFSGSIMIVVPYSTVEPLKDKLSSNLNIKW